MYVKQFNSAFNLLWKFRISKLDLFARQGVKYLEHTIIALLGLLYVCCAVDWLELQ